ncbi:MAG TPA: metallophosphoesterase [Flavisolibacter sp.]|nr:metallophosphoesterase [Flavisolibacter sp.]
MTQWFRKVLYNVILWSSNKFTSKPVKERVFRELTDLYNCINDGRKKKGIVIPFSTSDKFIIFSDQHKGAKNGADDFMLCEPNYLNALDYYYDSGYTFISLGDSEELWENTLTAIKKSHKESFTREAKFFNSKRFYKIFGNHDLIWVNDPFAPFHVKDVYGVEMPIYEGVVLRTELAGGVLNIFCTHGHQGDLVSDGNWFSKFFISRIWAPLQAFTKINPNTPAYDTHLKSLHNSMMYEWSSHQKDILLVTGHTHQPVFESLTSVERLYKKLLIATADNNQNAQHSFREEIKKRKFEENHFTDDYLSLKPTYFNAGCCCFNDGDITGIEIADGCIRLVKWKLITTTSQRQIVDEASLESLANK